MCSDEEREADDGFKAIENHNRGTRSFFEKCLIRSLLKLIH
jgi:hypothetical protein